MATKVKNTGVDPTTEPSQMGLDWDVFSQSLDRVSSTEPPSTPVSYGRNEVKPIVEAKKSAPVLIEFVKIVTGSSLAISMEEPFKAKGARLSSKVPEVISRAWALATEPANLVAMSLFHLGKIKENFYYNNPERLDWDIFAKSVFSGFDDHQVNTFCSGIEALGGEIAELGALNAFQEAGRRGSKLLVNATSKDLLAYPALGVGLSPTSSIVDGKKSPTVSGVKLRWTGRMNRENDHGGPALDQRAWLARFGANPSVEVAQTIKEGLDFAEESTTTAWGNFIAVGEKEVASSSYLSGEVPLPSAQSYKESFQSSEKGRQLRILEKPLVGMDGKISGQQGTLGHVETIPRAQYVQQRTTASLSAALGAWSWAASAAMAPESAKGAQGSPGLDRAKRLLLGGGVFSQLGQSFLIDWKALGGAVEPKELSAHELTLEQSYGRSPTGDSMSRTLAIYLAKKAQDDKLGAAEAALSISKVLFGRSKKGEPSPFEAAAKNLSLADARIGLSQLAISLMGMKNAFDDPYNRSRFQSSNMEANNAKSMEGRRLEAALEKLALGMEAARGAFAKSALDEAENLEAAWMHVNGLGAAWAQAGQAGARSPKSVGWSVANPVGASLESDDPMARLAAQCARGLGLQAKAGEAELVSSLRDELFEMGASKISIDELSGQPKLSAIIANLSGSLAGVDKKKAYASRQALHFAAHAMSSAIELRMPSAELERFCQSYLVDESVDARDPHYRHGESKLDLFIAGAAGADGCFDGLGPSLSGFAVGNVAKAKLAGDVCRAKAEGYSKLVGALVADWFESTQRAMDLGQSELAASEIAAARAKEVRVAFPKQALIDWRKRPFENKALWEVFSMPSPRFSAAVADAKAKGGALGEWCALRARRLGVDDALGGNDLVAKSRDKIKARCKMSDGAWKLAIKDVSMLSVITQDLDLERGHLHKLDAASVALSARFENGEEKELVRRVSGDSQADARLEVDYAATIGIGLKAASVANLGPQTVGAVLETLTGRGKSRQSRKSELFSDNIAEVVSSGAEGADFFIAEAAEKAARMPKIFVECCKRYEKLVADAAKEDAKSMAREAAGLPENEPVEDGREARGGKFNPLAKFEDEVADLCDWIGKSEHGLWSEIPKDPTFGQLSRMSKAWHDEQAALAIDKADRARVARAVADAVHETSGNPYAVSSSSRWGKLLGRHARDGWEAVEMLSAGDLTEEGATMRHCVSSYSPTCRSGVSRIFSIKLNGERKCTLQIQGQSPLSKLDMGNVFRIMQNKGPSNQAVNNAATVAFCEEVVAKINATWPLTVVKSMKARDTKAEDKKLVAKKAKEDELTRIEAERSKPSAPKLS